MQEEIKVLSGQNKIRVHVSTNNSQNTLEVEKDLTKYYSDLAKNWAISANIVNNEDYSAKYYAQNAKIIVESVTEDLRQEIENNVQLAQQQVQLAQQQVDIMEQKAEEHILSAEQAADRAQEIADGLVGKYSDIDLSNITSNGIDVIKNNSKGLPVGTIFAHISSSSYVPENSLLCDGSEYTSIQFSTFYTDWLVGARLKTCTYQEYQNELIAYGECLKFGLDVKNGRFKVPTKKSEWVVSCKNTVPVVGNGKALGLSSGSNVGGLVSSHTYMLAATNSAYGTGIGTINGNWNPLSVDKQSLGLVADASNSGVMADTSNLLNKLEVRYFVVISTGTINQSEMDWSNWASSLQGKLNADHSNDTKPYIKETYVNGTSWYRLWSDNWCEQGGFIVSNENSNVTIYVTFLKPFRDTNYTSLATSTGQINTYPSCDIRNRTNQNMIVNRNNSYSASWYACGYI